MPLFAMYDANDRVVNVAAAARKEDLLETVSHGEGVEGDYAEGLTAENVLKSEHRQVEGYGDPVFVPTDFHLRTHGAVGLVEVTKDTGPARVGMRIEGGKFVPGPEPLAAETNETLIAEMRRRGLVAAPAQG